MGDSSASASGARNSTTSRHSTTRSSARSSTRSRSSGAAAVGGGSNHHADGGGQDDSPSSSSSSSSDAGNAFENFRSIEFGVVGWEEKDETHYTAARYRNSNSDLDSQDDDNNDNSPKRGGRRKSAMPHHKYDSEEEDGDKVEEAKEEKGGRRKGRRHTDIPKTTPATTATKMAATAKNPQMNFNFISQDSPTATTARNSSISNTDIMEDGRPSSPFIQFSHDKLYGRDRELQQFQSLYQRMIQHNQSQAVFLSAYSGSGKTRLVYEAVQRFPKASASTSNSTSKHPLPRFVHGKHEVQELDAPVPYKALSEAFQRWHVQLSETEQAHLHRFLHEELHEAVGDDVTVLGEIIPSFRPIIGSNSADGGSGGKGTTAAAAAAITTIVEGSHMMMGDSQATLYFDAHADHHDDDEHDNRSHTNNATQTQRTQRTPPQRPQPHHHHHHHRRQNSENDDVMNKSRLHYVFVSFLRCLCTRESPLVIYIDDLQWADAYTLELLETILSDPTTIQHIFFIGAYRSNEVNPHDHPLAKIISSLQNIEKEQQPSSTPNNNNGKIPSSQDETMQQQQLGRQKERQKALHIETIELSDLSKDQVGEFIADTLQLEVDQVQPLTEAIYRKTLGNIFFTKQALEQLVRRNALYFDMVVFQWQWRLPQDKLEETLSDDIVEMIQSKIECLPMNLQHVLAVAAHTRSSLDVETLVELLNAFRKYEQKQEYHDDNRAEPSDDNHSNSEEQQHAEPNPYFTATSVQELLEHAVMSGLLCCTTTTAAASSSSSTGKTNSDNTSTPGKLEYAFAHDRIREAARAFVKGEKLHKLSFIIGKVLAKRGTDDTVGEDWMMFTAIHHLNSVPSIYHEDEEARLTLAKLNLITAKLAMGRAAFEDAAKYAEKGIEVLPVDRWEQCTVLCHELYALAAEACRFVGNIQQMERYCAACLTAERDRPLEANYQVYYTLAVGLFYGSDRYGEAKDILLNLLKHLDCRFPTSPTMTKSSTMLKVGLLVATKNSRTEHEIERMELMTDPTKMRAMKLLDRLFDICYITKDDVLMTLVIFRALEYTLKFGLCVYSPRLVASVCCIFTGALNDLKGGGLYANYSRQLLKRVNHKPSESGTMLLSYVFGSQWVTPIRDCIEPLRSAHRIGLHTGAVENACWCMYFLVVCSFQAGCPLQPIAAECKAHAQRMEDFGQRMISLHCKAQLLTLLGIMGISKDEFPLNLSEAESNVPILVEAFEAKRRWELTYNGEYQLVAESTVKHGEAYIKNAPGAPQPSYDLAISGVSCLEAARQTGKPEYLREAKRIRKWINSWAKQGSPNFQHWKVLLDAGFAAQKGNVKATVQYYQQAVELATDGGYIHDAALANELWAAFALDVLSDEAETQLRLHDAIKFYAKWGALGKVQRIKAKYPTFFQQRTSYASNAG